MSYDIEEAHAALFTQHSFRIERLEQAFLALLDDVAHNPNTAVLQARSIMMRRHDETQSDDWEERAYEQAAQDENFG